MNALPRFALSIRQPWAYAIASLGKDVENRSWHVSGFVGKTVCVHVSNSLGTRAERAADIGWITSNYQSLSAYAGFDLPELKDVPEQAVHDRGGIIGTVDIVDCVTKSASPWYFGKYGFVLNNYKAIPFIPVKGSLGFFEWVAS